MTSAYGTLSAPPGGGWNILLQRQPKSQRATPNCLEIWSTHCFRRSMSLASISIIPRIYRKLFLLCLQTYLFTPAHPAEGTRQNWLAQLRRRLIYSNGQKRKHFMRLIQYRRRTVIRVAFRHATKRKWIKNRNNKSIEVHYKWNVIYSEMHIKRSRNSKKHTIGKESRHITPHYQ